MKWRPDGEWFEWTGVEEISAREVGFVWRARFSLFPGVWLSIEDAYAAGQGRLVGKLGGWLRLFRQTGPELDVAEAMRYLAELPWAPHALSNPNLSWTETDDGGVEVSTQVGTHTAAVQLTLDDEGRITGAFAPARTMTDGRTSVLRPWGGTFTDYAQIDGWYVPRRGEVFWELPEGRFIYWQGEILSVETL